MNTVKITKSKLSKESVGSQCERCSINVFGALLPLCTLWQIISEDDEKYILSCAPSDQKRAVIKKFLETTKGYNCTLTEWFKEEPAWVVPNASYENGHIKGFFGV